MHAITKEKTFPAMTLSQKNFRVKTLVLDEVHLTLPHPMLPITASDGFINGSVAETLEFKKPTKF